VNDPKSILLSRRARFVAAALAATGIAVHHEAARGDGRPTVDASAEPPNEETRRMADEHFERASRLFVEGNFEAARVELERSHQLAPDPKKLRALAAVNEQLNDWARAYEVYVHLEDHVRAVAALEHCATIDVAIPASAKELQVDDVATTPRDGRLVVNPGRRKISMVYRDAMPETHFVTVVSGDHVAITFAANPSPCLVPVQRGGCHCDVPGLRTR
jgi:hypothetical protein